MKCPKCGWEITKLYVTEVGDDCVETGTLGVDGYHQDTGRGHSSWEYMCGNHECYAILYTGSFVDSLEEVFEYIEEEQDE